MFNYNIVAEAITDKGNIREINQDSYIVIKKKDNKIHSVALLAVADGVGGLEEGEIASYTAINALENWWVNELDNCIESNYSYDDYKREFIKIFTSINEEILVYQKEKRVIMGTTCSMLFFIDGYMANVFTTENLEYLTAVSFYTFEKNDDYEVYVVNNYESPQSLVGLKNPIKTGTFEESGYHTVKIDPITLNAGDKFAVVVRLKNSKSKISFAVEYPHSYYENARANSGESFISSNGNVWQDVYNKKENMNLCIKAFTIDPTNLEALQEGVDNVNREYESDKVYTLDELGGDVELNPEFVEYYNNQHNNDGLNILSTDNGDYSMGAIPDPVKIDDNGYKLAQGMIIPKKYDLREEKLVTSVKDQGEYGTCWAFAVYASLESCILKNSSYVSGDFSELNDIVAELNKNSNIEVKSLDIAEKNIVLSAGESKNIKIDISPINATSQNLLWVSSNTAVASVNSLGYVTAKNCGRATITAMIVTEKGVITASCNIVVTQDGKLFGDADNNLKVDENDVEEVMKKALDYDYKMAIEQIDSNWILLLDYDGDGKITASDVAGLKYYVANNK